MKKILTKYELQTLSEAIAEAEKRTSGEIRVVVRHRRHWAEKKLSLFELGLKEFHSLGMQKTKARSGVLILLLLSERKFQIIADEGIHSKTTQEMWDEIAMSLTEHFKQGKFCKGLSESVRAVGQELAKHFPPEAGDKNELPNEIVEK